MFTAESFALRLKRANLGSKIDIANLVNEADFYYKLKEVPLKKN